MRPILIKLWVLMVIAVLCYALWMTHIKAERFRQVSYSLENTITDINQEMAQTRIQLNDSVQLLQAEVIDLVYTKKNLESKYNQLLKASKLKPKDVSSVTQVTTVVHQIDTVVAEVDTFGGLKARLEDPFVSIDVEVKPDLKTLIDYEMRDSLTIITVQKKHSWLFGLIKWKEHKSTRVINHNPKASVVNLQTIDVLE